jgi:sugar lactone lactonase YvrE
MLLGASPALAQANYEPYAIVTLAGRAGRVGSANGTGSAAGFYDPVGVAVDSAGNVYVADSNNQTIRKITSSGVVSTVAGLAGAPGSADGTGSAARFSTPLGVAVDSAGNLYVADTINRTIRKITAAGVVTTLAGLAGTPGSADGTGSAARFDYPNGVAVDSAGNLYVADSFNSTIRKVTAGGVVSTLAGLAAAPGSADGTGSAARFANPRGVAVDSTGNLYVADSFNSTIRKVTSGGVVTTMAGFAGASGSADGTGRAARFNSPFGVAVDSAGNVYVADPNNQTIRKITSDGVVKTLAGFAGATGSADGTASVARFNYPFGVAVDSAGNVYVGDTSNHTIRAGALAPPLITSPLTASATVGQQLIYQFETIGATSRSVTKLPAGLTFNGSFAAITGTPTAAGTFQVGLSASNAAGTTTATLTITVQPVPSSGPVLVTSTSATGRVGRPFNFQVVTIGGSPSARVSANALPPGLTLNSVTGLISGTSTAEGSSAVNLTVTDENLTTSSSLQLTFTADPAIPVIISLDRGALIPGKAFSYTIDAPCTAPPSDPTIFTKIGELPSGLSFDATTGTISGTYPGPLQSKNNINDGGGGPPEIKPLSGGALLGSIQLFGTNSHGTSTFQLLFLAGPSGAVNIATRLLVGTDENVLIGGFIISGSPNVQKVVIVRAIGPSIGIPGSLQDPILELHDSHGGIVINDDWRTTQEKIIKDTTIQPGDDRESAIVIGLDPGNYTAIVSSKNGAPGIGLMEVYDLGNVFLDASGKAILANIATRGFVDTNDNVMIGGFIIQTGATKVVVRAVGPSLSKFGIQKPLPDPFLELHDGSGSLMFSNDNWQDNSAQAEEIQKLNLGPSDLSESALVGTLPPGNYTAIVRGKDNTMTGVALVEAYMLP